MEQVAGLFWNYLSVGLDAQSAYGFHSIRESRPWLTPSRLANQAWYSYFSCATGWFCGAPPIATKASLKVPFSYPISPSLVFTSMFTLLAFAHAASKAMSTFLLAFASNLENSQSYLSTQS